MNKYTFLTTVLICISLLVSCVEELDLSSEPAIEFGSFSSDTIAVSRLGSRTISNDTLEISILFEDGDADIGGNNPTLFFSYPINDNTSTTARGVDAIPERGAGQGVTGEITVLAVPDNLRCDSGADSFISKRFEIYIVDRAQNESNRILTPPIVFECLD